MHLAFRTLMTITVAAAMAAPVAQAEWYAFGSFEPDTTYDSEWQFTDAPGVGESKLYFAVITTTSYSTLTKSVNPNVGALQTQIEPTNVEYHHAYLGVWKDCNGDKYIGSAESALREYPAALLSQTDACPPATGPANAWTTGAHNYNGWVSELVPIVNIPMQNIDARTYRDDDARVWGDYHRPDEDPWFRSCTLRPFARGTLHDTGGFLNYFDCRQPILENANILLDAIGDPAGLRFPDEDDARTGTLGQVTLGGDESDDHAAVHTVDCSSEPTNVGHTVNQTSPDAGAEVPVTAQAINVWSPSPSLDGSPGDTTLAGQANATVEETPVVDNCDTSNDFGHDLYEPVAGVAFETDFNGVDPKNKLEADWNFGFNGSTVVRGAQAYTVTAPALGWGGTAGAPTDNGVGIGGTHWVSDSTWLSKLGPRSVKLDLESGGAEINQAYWLSFYAHLGTATLNRGFARATSNVGTYGSWHCGSNTEGIHHGWNCDESLWYMNPDGSFPPGSTMLYLAKPGWTYHLLDVDCMDGRIGETGVSVEPAFYGAEPCIAP